MFILWDSLAKGILLLFKLNLHFQLPVLAVFSERGIDGAHTFAFTKESVQPL